MTRGCFNPALPYSACVSEDDVVTLTDANGNSISEFSPGAYRLVMILTGGERLATDPSRGERYSFGIETEGKRLH